MLEAVKSQNSGNFIERSKIFSRTCNMINKLTGEIDKGNERVRLLLITRRLFQLNTMGTCKQTCNYDTVDLSKVVWE